MWTYANFKEVRLHTAELTNVDLVHWDELDKILSFQIKKTSGWDDFNAELSKYAHAEIEIRFFNIINICWTTYKIPEE